MWARAIVLAVAALFGCKAKQQPVAATSKPTTSVPEAWPAAAEEEPDDFELGGEPAPVGDPNDCNPFVTAVERRGGNLVVRAPPDTVDRPFLGRLRNHTQGALLRGSPRVWIGPQVPGFVPLTEGTQELTLLDHVGDEFVALYRDPYGASSCTLDDDRNCEFTAKLFEYCGALKWSVRLNDFMSRTRYLELQDIRYDDGVLYFNEACQSYSRAVKGRCSSLVAVDPAGPKLLWRTKPLVSNGRFLVHGDHIVTGYGFTAERDHVFVVRRRDGKVVHERSVPSAPQDVRLVGDDTVEVVLYPGDQIRHYRLGDWTSATPTLVESRTH